MKLENPSDSPISNVKQCTPHGNVTSALEKNIFGFAFANGESAR